MNTVKYNIGRLLSVFAVTLSAALISASCSKDVNGGGPDYGESALTISISMEGHNSELPTRASVDALPAEEQLESLTMLFFEYSDDASGKFINSYTITTGLTMNVERPINISDVAGLNNSTAYSILAVANVADNRYIGETLSSWLSGFANKTETQAMTYAVGRLTSGQVIEAGKILMTGSTSKTADQQKMELVLKRAVARYDVLNLKRDAYDLVTVAVSNVANRTAMWDGLNVDVTSHFQPLYRVTAENSINGDNTSEKKDILGGLYSFENFVVAPAQDDDVTTCLVIGLAPRSGSPFTGWNQGEVRYFRVNVHPEGSSQNIKRNNAYRITVRNVLEAGAASEADAMDSESALLDYVINNWDYDDNGMILFDGVNTLVAPVKTVILDPAGDSREYSIFTQGPGTLTVENYVMDNGITATLSGNTLKVTATPLSGTETERTGSLDLALGGLRGTIYFIQSPQQERFLRLNKSKTVSFPGYGVNEMLDGPLEVSSSGPWKAKIFNNNQADPNPGFSFSDTNAAMYEFSQTLNGGSNTFQVYTTGDNMDETTSRYSFILVWLEEDENVNSSLVLMQKPTSSFSVSPAMPNNTVAFNAIGVPPVQGSNQTPGGTFKFTVLSGDGDGVTNLVNPWKVELTGTYKDYFTIVQVMDTGDDAPGANYFTIAAKGTSVGSATNNLSVTLTAQIVVSLDIAGSGDKSVTINVTQVPLTFSVKEDNNDNISEKGGVVNNDTGLPIVTTAPSTYTWSATVKSQSHASTHPVYFVDESDQQVPSLSGMALTSNLRVGFGKIMYPLVYEEPYAVIEVTLDGTNLKYELTVTQDMLKQRDFWLQSARNSYGYIRPNLASGATFLAGEFLAAWRAYLWGNAEGTGQHNMFGPSGVVNVRSKNFYYLFLTEDNTKGGEVWENVTWMQVARAASLDVSYWPVIDRWRAKNDGNWTMIMVDDVNNNAYTNYLGAKGYTRGSLLGGDGTPRINPAVTNTKLMRYLLKDGPFTGYGSTADLTGGNNDEIGINWTFYSDATRNPAASFPQQSVAVIQEANAAGTSFGNGLVIVDFKNRFVYVGETQLFDTYVVSAANLAIANGGVTANRQRSKFIANLLAWMVNATMYGTHFTDLFLEDDWDPIPPVGN